MKNLFILLAVLLIFSGCQEDNKILNSPTDQLNKQFTISGTADGYTTFPLGEQAPHRHFEGEGQSSPGGNVHLVLDYLMTSFNPPNGTSGFGTGEVITESGDKIFVTGGSGTFTITGNTVNFTATGPISGGTGEYDNVMGTLTYSGTIDVVTRATHAEWTGTFTRQKPFGGNLVAENVTVTGSCSPGYVRRQAEGTGNAVHFGKHIVSMEHCVNYTTGIIADGTSSLEAANGDKIFVNHYGYVIPIPGSNLVNAIMIGTIIGGEGRFENASGSFWVKGTQELPAGAAICNFDGVIKY